MNGPVEIRLVDEDQRKGHERERREKAGAQQEDPFGPHFTRMDAIVVVAGRGRAYNSSSR